MSKVIYRRSSKRHGVGSEAGNQYWHQTKSYDILLSITSKRDEIFRNLISLHILLQDFISRVPAGGPLLRAIDSQWHKLHLQNC